MPRFTFRLVGQILAATSLAACARTAATSLGEPRLTDGATTMTACTPVQSLVVENKTGYPVNVIAGDGGPNSFPGSSVRLWTVQSGAIDTVGAVPGDRKRLFFNVERPALPSGAPMKVRGLRAWCASRTE